MNETRQSIVGSHQVEAPSIRQKRKIDWWSNACQDSRWKHIRIPWINGPANTDLPCKIQNTLATNYQLLAHWPGKLESGYLLRPAPEAAFQVPGGNARSTNFDLIFSTYNYPYWLSASPSNPTQSFTNQGQNLK